MINVKKTGIKNFGVGTCTFVDLEDDTGGTESGAEGCFEFMQTVEQIKKSTHCSIKL